MKIFVDSSLLVEYEKQSKTDLLDALLESDHQIFINPIVISEYLYQLLGILGGRSPMAICESKKIAETLAPHDTASFLSGFQLLSIPDAAYTGVHIYDDPVQPAPQRCHHFSFLQVAKCSGAG